MTNIFTADLWGTNNFSFVSINHKTKFVLKLWGEKNNITCTCTAKKGNVHLEKLHLYSVKSNIQHGLLSGF